MTGKIKSIKARQILDSRGFPTVETDLIVEHGSRVIIARASVPSGASTGSHEAVELRDGDAHLFLGKSVERAVNNVNQVIASRLVGESITQVPHMDQWMIELDGTPNKSKLGANAILSVSLALARALALTQEKSLVEVLRQEYACPRDLRFTGLRSLPTPLMNVINGGAHANNNLSIQEFMLVPHLKQNFAHSLRLGVETFHHLKKILKAKKMETAVGDEGGFAPSLERHEQALELLVQATEAAGHRVGEDISYALDVAASEFYDQKTGRYQFEGRECTSDEMIEYYEKLIKKFPIYSIEDGLSEFDHAGWKKLQQRLGSKILTIGDDLYVTNTKLLQQGIEQQWSNGILIKPNQIGTLTETLQCMGLAFAQGMTAIASHRSGETADTFIADLSVATSCGHIKTGSASRSDRLEKYNQLLRLSENIY